MKTLSLLGAGGHAKVVLETAVACGRSSVRVFDDRQAGDLLGIPVSGALASSPVDQEALVAIGDNKARKAIVERLGRSWATLIHPAASVSRSAALSPGAVVFAGAIIQAEARIGNHAIVNTGATVDHDCFLGDYSQVCPGVSLSGNVTLGEGAFLGTGAAVLPGITIGAWAIIGAGAVVVHDIPPGATAVGNPARFLEEETR